MRQDTKDWNKVGVLSSDCSCAYRQYGVLEVWVLGHEEVCTPHNHSCLNNIDRREAQPGLHVARTTVQLDKDQRDEAGKEQANSNQPPVRLHSNTHKTGSASLG